MNDRFRKAVLIALLLAATLIPACTGNIGVGLNVGVPVGDHGYVSFGTSRWY